MNALDGDTAAAVRRGYVVACRRCDRTGTQLVATRAEAEQLAHLHNTQIHRGQLHQNRPPASAQPASGAAPRGRRRAAVRALLRGLATGRTTEP
jgi:hypothetical protein